MKKHGHGIAGDIINQKTLNAMKLNGIHHGSKKREQFHPKDKKQKSDFYHKSHAGIFVITR